MVQSVIEHEDHMENMNEKTFMSNIHKTTVHEMKKSEVKLLRTKMLIQIETVRKSSIFC